MSNEGKSRSDVLARLSGSAAAYAGPSAEKGWRVRKDGSRFWASTVLTALRDKTGHLRGYQSGGQQLSSEARGF